MNSHPQPAGATTTVSRLIRAPRSAVYAALVDGDAVASWLPPDAMTGIVHAFEPRAGGLIHMTLHYPDVESTPDGAGGKSSGDADTFRGRFLALVPDEKVVWLTEFDSPDPAFAGEMTLVWSMADAPGGTEVTVMCENIPRGIRPEDNEAGTRSSLANLAAFVE